MKIRTALVVVCLIVFSGVSENIPEESARMKWWRDARFGMFIHWGLYAVPAGTYHGEAVEGYSEWIMAYADIPIPEYETYAAAFNPGSFDAGQWVQMAVDAGVKYIVITSKHHDGFSMFDTQFSEYDIVQATPYGKDPMAALSAACKKAGLPFGVYYSTLDWHHDSQEKNAEYTGRPAYRNAVMLEGQKERYVGYMKNQLREIIEKYDPAILWFDGEWVDWWSKEDGRNLENYLRSLKPSLVINNRVGKRGKDDGDFGTPEQEIPDTGLDMDWETCMTINGNWGYDRTDQDWKSTETLLRNLVDIVSKGGNFLLNIGPTAEGVVPAASVERLHEMGEWLAINGQAVYGTSASPVEKPAWGRYTAKGNLLYAHVFDWPADRQLQIPGGAGTLKNAELLSENGAIPLQFNQTDLSVTVLLPETAPSVMDSVVVLEF